MKINSVALILGILILACLMITPVMGENINGSLGSSAWNTTNYPSAESASGVAPLGAISGMVIKDIEKTSGFRSLVAFRTTAFFSGDVGAPYSAQTSVDIYPSYFPGTSNFTPNLTHKIGTGTLGYQRSFNNAVPPVEVLDFVYILIDSDQNWNLSGLSGNQNVNFIYNPKNLYNFSSDRYSVESPTSGYSMFLSGSAGHTVWVSGKGYTQNKEATAYGFYNLDKPSQLGIAGYVNKTNGAGGSLLYPSRVFISDRNHTTVASELLINPNPFSFTVPFPQVYVGILTANGVWYNSSLLFQEGGLYPTPTQTPIAGGIYTMTTSTDYVNVSGTNTVTISSLTDPTLADLKFIHYGYSDSTNADTSFNEVGSTILKSSYSLIGGQWTGYNAQSVEYDNVLGAIPNPYTLKWDTTNGDKTLVVTLQNSAGDYTYLTRTIHVGQGTQTLIETKVQAVDGTNGGNVGMVSMQIYNHNTATWTNLSPNDGLGKIITPANTILSFYVQKIGFTNGTLMTQPARADLTYQVPLFIGPTVGAGFVNYFVTVQDSNGYPLGGASIAITPAAGATKSATSSTNGGSQIFNLTASTLHTYSISKSGYQAQSGSFTTGTTAGSLSVKLLPLVTPTRTYVIPTGSWTVSPTYGTSNTTFWEPWKRVFGMMGANSTELPILIAGLVIILCMAAGAGMAGVLGAEVAMGFGAILCVALGLIPIWVVLAIIILGFLFYGLKIGR